jgi:hypothetical protein
MRRSIKMTPIGGWGQNQRDKRGVAGPLRTVETEANGDSSTYERIVVPVQEFFYCLGCLKLAPVQNIFSSFAHYFT